MKALKSSEKSTSSNNIKSQDKLQPEEQMERHGMAWHANTMVSVGQPNGSRVMEDGNGKNGSCLEPQFQGKDPVLLIE